MQEMQLEALLSKITLILNGEIAKTAKLQSICNLLKTEVAHYDWVGFYRVDPAAPQELVLGPFAGAPTDHVRIPFGKGICGQAAEREETFVIQDVSQETNYLSCSLHVKSEIVVPVFKNGKIAGELDIDSHQLAPFTAEDQRFLKQVAEAVGTIL